MASSLWAGGTNTTEGPDNSRISTKGTGFAGIGGTSGASMIVFGTIAGGAGAALTGGNFWQGAATGLIVSGLNHAMHSGDGEDPPTKCTLKKIELTNSDGLTQDQYDNLSTFEKMFTPPPGIIASSGGLELIGGPAKGLKYLSKMASKYPGAIVKAEQVGSKYWKYTTEVAGTNGRTIYTKYLNLQGKTIQWFHDSYNASNQFMHREFNAVGGRLKVWYDGTREYIKKF